MHTAAYHGHPDILDLLLSEAVASFDFGAHKNRMDETPMDVARERFHFCPSNREALKVFTCLFGRDPNAQEKASRVKGISGSSREVRTFNQSFVEAVASTGHQKRDLHAIHSAFYCDYTAVASQQNSFCAKLSKAGEGVQYIIGKGMLCRVHDDFFSVRFHISMKCHFFIRLLYQMCRKYDHSGIVNRIWTEFVPGHGPLYGKAVSE